MGQGVYPSDVVLGMFGVSCYIAYLWIFISPTWHDGVDFISCIASMLFRTREARCWRRRPIKFTKICISYELIPGLFRRKFQV